MANALLDENSRPTMTAELNTTGSSVIRVTADPSTHAVDADDNTTGSDHGDGILTDENGRPSLFAVSSSDGITLIPLYADSTGQLLIKST